MWLNQLITGRYTFLDVVYSFFSPFMSFQTFLLLWTLAVVILALVVWANQAKTFARKKQEGVQ